MRDSRQQVLIHVVRVIETDADSALLGTTIQCRGPNLQRHCFI